MVSERYQYRAALQAEQAIGRARHWLDRLAQLAQFENVVVRPVVERGGYLPDPRAEQPHMDADGGPS
jgi:hypothetical protein